MDRRTRTAAGHASGREREQPARCCRRACFRRLSDVAPAALVCAVTISALPSVRADDRAGERIYRQHCAACHGASGQGTADNHPEPLLGDRSVAELADLIARTMPDGAPEECAGEDAAQVAAYIHEAFYSPMAQARHRPPRVELARLTVREYKNTVADLVASFASAAPAAGSGDAEQGLKGEYYKSRRFRGDNRVLERVDAAIQFDFGQSSPDPDKIDPKEYAIRWEGAVFAPDTGEYEFIIHAKNGV
ncbi:MAG TPA: c-type cytochrome, partial [Planctomycetaceae bacterium]|nr:c-type cytochrome [Planctomycetaceae bacterium]